MKHKKQSLRNDTPAGSAQSWSLRSQKSLKSQHEIEEKIGKFENLIAGEEKSIKAAEINRTRQANLVAGGQYVYQVALSKSIEEIAERKGRIAAYREVASDLRAEMKALVPSPAQAAERAAKQAELAKLAKERIEAVESIDAAIRVLGQRLNVHAKLTAAMVKLAREIDFTGEDFDSPRFDNLALSLPTAMQAESRRWLEWFLGTEKDWRACEIRREVESFPETLAAAHYYRRGEKPLLTEKQRAVVEKENPRGLSTVEAERLYYSPQTPEAQIDTRNFPGNGILGPY
jgi:hypothetical protein